MDKLTGAKMPKGFEFDQVHPDTPLVARRKLGEQLVYIVQNEYTKLAAIAEETGVPVSLDTLHHHLRDFGRGVVSEALRQAEDLRMFDVDEALGAIYPPTRFRPNPDRIRYM